MVEDASSDNEEELARAHIKKGKHTSATRNVLSRRLQHAQDIEDPNGAFFTVPAKKKNNEILFYRLSLIL